MSELGLELISAELVNYIIQVKIGFGNKIITDCMCYLPGQRKNDWLEMSWVAG